MRGQKIVIAAGKSEVLQAINDIVGHAACDVLMARFQPLDGVFFGDLDNLSGMLVHIYSTASGWHKYINEALWSGQPSEAVAVFSEALNGVLWRLPSLPDTARTVYRGFTPRNLPEFRNRYRPGALVRHNGFTSASIDPEGEYGGQVLFVIMTRSGRRIDYLAAEYEPGEVLVPSGATFIVGDVAIRGERLRIELVEVQTL